MDNQFCPPCIREEERERCAKVAEGYLDSLVDVERCEICGAPYCDELSCVSDGIAKRIREGK